MSINLEGLVPVKCVRMGGQVDWDDALAIPNGLAIVSQNMQFLAESVKVRWGLQFTAKGSQNGNPTGTDVLTVLGDATPPSVQQGPGGGSRSNSSIIIRHPLPPSPPNTNIPANTQVGLTFTDQGELFLELPAGSGNLVQIASSGANARIATSIAGILPTASVMQTAKAYNRIYQAFSNLVASTGPVLALDAATGQESPVGQNPIAAVWLPSTFYQQGDIVTSFTNPAVWWRRLNTGYSGATEPTWPTGIAALGYFTPSYVATYAQALDGGTIPEWQEWTMAVPSFLPAPPAFNLSDQPGSGSIPAGRDVYVALAYSNDLGESLWTFNDFLNTAAADALQCSFGTANPASGPPMPRWLQSIMGLGTSDNGFHWPPANCISVYVAAVAHGDPEPTEYVLYGTQPADRPVGIDSIPSGASVAPPISKTAALSAELFMGEAGIRQAILLRQSTLGDLSPVDPQCAIGVQFYGAVSEGATIAFVESSGILYISVDDITQFATGATINVQGQGLGTAAGASAVGNQTITGIYPGQNVSGTTPFAFGTTAYPAGMIACSPAGLSAATTDLIPGSISIPAGPCAVAIVPPGVQEGAGYSYDIVAFSVVGLSPSGPFNYLATADPANPFSTTILSETTDGQGNGQATVEGLSGLAAGDTVLVAGFVGGSASLNGQRVLASIGALNNVVTFPDPSPSGTYEGGPFATMSIAQTEPTLVAPGTLGILMQFDDTTLPEGVDVTGNLLFVAVPPSIDVAYLPSLQRMCYVSDQQPTSLIFSEIGFMGEVDGLNDVLAVEQSNGSRTVGARELLNGMIVACKESGGYQVVPSADVPANWGLNRLWGEHGPWSGRNIATTLDGLVPDFLIFVDPDTGVYKWPPTLGEGELDWLSKELSGANNQDASRMATWDRVNRAAGQQIQVVIDTIAKEIKVAVPLDGATTPNYILTMSYFNGWQMPLMMTLSGDWVPSRQARRWNLDPIPTRAMALVKRTLAIPVDQRVNYRQLIIGQWAATAGQVALLYMQPGEYNDLGAGIIPRYRPAYAREAPSQQWPNGGRVLRFVATTGHLIGQGKATITAFTDDPEYEATPKLVPLNTGEPEVPGSAPVTHFNESLKGDNEFLTVEFSTDGEPGSWFQLIENTFWHKPLFPTR